jgi:5-methyltetrahydrofolate--homocysteine methyltransferase
MDESEFLNKIREAVVRGDIDGARETAREAIKAGVPALKLVNAMSSGMVEVGKLLESRVYFVAEVLVSAEAMSQALEVLKPYLSVEEAKKYRGKVMLGTVEGDIHDIGKGIVATLLQTAGFEVVDLGVDVPAERFIEKIREVKPDILGLSSLLTTSLPEIKKIVEKLEVEGLRDKVKVIVGGAAVTKEFAEEAGVDVYCLDAVEAVEICKKYVEVVR